MSQQFGMQQPGQPVVVEPDTPPKRPSFCQTGSLICGILQLCLASLLFGIGYMKMFLYFPTYGVHSAVGGICSILAGSFGIHSSRTQAKCPTITSLVFSILTVSVMTSAVIVNSILLTGEAYIEENLASMILHDAIDANVSHEVELAILTIEHTMAEAAEGSMAMMILGGLANCVVSILQAVFTSWSVCTCWRTLPNLYGQFTNPVPEQRQPNSNAYTVDTSQMSSAA